MILLCLLLTRANRSSEGQTTLRPDRWHVEGLIFKSYLLATSPRPFLSCLSFPLVGSQGRSIWKLSSHTVSCQEEWMRKGKFQENRVGHKPQRPPDEVWWERTTYPGGQRTEAPASDKQAPGQGQDCTGHRGGESALTLTVLQVQDPPPA